jgi:hypothetical protein
MAVKNGKISGWRHSGFSAHSKVKASTKQEAEKVGKYMIRPLLSLERLSFSEKEGKVSCRYGKDTEEVERYEVDPLLLVLDFSVLCVISSFQDVSGWKLQRMGGIFGDRKK